jgi:hypothetical protein
MQQMTGESVLIGGGEIGRCPTRIHHDRFTRVRGVPDPVVADRIERGRDWEEVVIAHLLDGTTAATVCSVEEPIDGSSPLIIPTGVPAPEREQITDRALTAGVPLLVGGRLVSPSLRSVGAPDLLVWLEAGYGPVDVKHHQVIRDEGIPARLTPIHAITEVADGEAFFKSNRYPDLLQIAHYWHLLDEAGHADPRHFGGIIGSEPGPLCVWVDLAAGDPAILDIASSELDRALEVVDSGRQDPQHPLVPAVWRGLCRSCPWHDYCRAELEATDHVSLLPAVGPKDTERLIAQGITTTRQLASVAPGTTLDDEEVDPEAILEANARTRGTLLRRDGVGLDLPSADIVVDFDIETYRGTVYLAGLLIGEGDRSSYHPIVDWTVTEAGERSVIAELFAFFDRLADRGDAVVYHWTGYERTMLDAASDRHGIRLRTAPDVDAWFDRYGCDLWAWTKARFVSPNGYSLKVIAPLCGFTWRDEDPGGAQSELWYVDAVAGDHTQRQRLLLYNEDDVAAQLAIRRWTIDRATESEG